MSQLHIKSCIQFLSRSPEMLKITLLTYSPYRLAERGPHTSAQTTWMDGGLKAGASGSTNPCNNYLPGYCSCSPTTPLVQEHFLQLPSSPARANVQMLVGSQAFMAALLHLNLPITRARATFIPILPSCSLRRRCAQDGRDAERQQKIPVYVSMTAPRNQDLTTLMRSAWTPAGA